MRLSSLFPGNARGYEKHKEVKAAGPPKAWDENPERLQQKGFDACGTKKWQSLLQNKSDIYIDVGHGFIRQNGVTTFWADSAHRGEYFNDLLSIGGFESLIHEMGTHNHPLSDAAKELNRVKSRIRAYGEHGFGCMTMSMGETLTGELNRKGTRYARALTSLKFNFLMYFKRFSQWKWWHKSREETSIAQAISAIVDA